MRNDTTLTASEIKRDKAMSLNRLLTDIDICDKKAESYKIINLSWKSEVDGEIFSYDVYVNDKKSANAVALKTLVNIELENIAPEIKTGIDKLKLRSQMLGMGYKGIVQDEEQSNHFML